MRPGSQPHQLFPRLPAGSLSGAGKAQGPAPAAHRDPSTEELVADFGLVAILSTPISDGEVGVRRGTVWVRSRGGTQEVLSASEPTFPRWRA